MLLVIDESNSDCSGYVSVIHGLCAATFNVKFLVLGGEAKKIFFPHYGVGISYASCTSMCNEVIP